MAEQAISKLASAISMVSMFKLIASDGTTQRLYFKSPIWDIVSKFDFQSDTRSSGTKSSHESFLRVKTDRSNLKDAINGTSLPPTSNISYSFSTIKTHEVIMNYS